MILRSDFTCSSKSIFILARGIKKNLLSLSFLIILFPFPYKKAEASFWTAEEIDLASDHKIGKTYQITKDTSSRTFSRSSPCPMAL